MDQPELHYLPDGYQWHVPDAGLYVQFRDLHSGSAGMNAEVEIYQTLSGERKNHYWADLNLKAPQSKHRLAQLMATRVPSYENWEPLIEMLCYLTAQEYRKPVEAEWVGGHEPASREYDIDPFMAANEPTIMFGNGGSGKTYLNLICCLAMASGESVVGLHPQQGPVMFVDYETDRDTFERRIRMLSRGLGLDYPQLLYYRGGIPFAKDIASIKANVLNYEVRHIWIDSASLAVGGQLENTEAVGQFFSALRQLGIGSTVITHTAKNTNGGPATAFGSVYWSNLSRSVWEVIGHQDEGSPDLSVGVKHTKVNEQGRQPRRGYLFQFLPDRVAVRESALDELPGLDDMVPTMSRIEAAIVSRVSARATIQEIAEETGLKPNTVDKTIRRHPNRFAVDSGGRGQPATVRVLVSSDMSE